MSNATDLQEKRAAIEAVPADDVKTPNMPVDAYLQEAEDLYHWAGDDKDALSGAGLATSLLHDLPKRAGACREAQSLWNKEYNSSTEAAKEWKEKGGEAFTFRDDLLADFRYAYRNNDDLLERVAAIAEGNDNADMVQDLNDLADLGRDNTAPLKKIHFDLAKLDLAAKTSDDMATLLARANGDSLKFNEAKMLRDKAFTYLKEAVDEIRDCGKYVFRKKPEKLKGYISRYFKH